MMSGNSETVDYQLAQIYDSLRGKEKANYYRIQPKIQNAKAAIDIADSENLQALREDGLLAVAEYQAQLDELVEKLIANH
jgi:hypothetical protein